MLAWHNTTGGYAAATFPSGEYGPFWPGRVYARKCHFQEAVQQTEDKEREEAAPEVAEGETTELEKTGKSSTAPVEETLQA